MSKSRISVKGEYGVGYAYGSTSVRDFQSLLDIRSAQTLPEDFQQSEHRLESVKTVRSVDFVNDSASVNQNGIYMALSNVTKSKSVTWITSFDDWNSIGAELLQMIVEKVSMIVYLGKCDDATKSFLNILGVRTEVSSDMETAVRIAFYGSSSDQQVLLCPGVPAGEEYGCSFAVRGKEFKNAVAQL